MNNPTMLDIMTALAVGESKARENPAHRFHGIFGCCSAWDFSDPKQPRHVITITEPAAG